MQMPEKDKATEAGSSESDFARQAEAPAPGFLAEFWDFLIHNKKWWLTPIIIVLLLVAVLVIFSASSPVAPFIYALF